MIKKSSNEEQKLEKYLQNIEQMINQEDEKKLTITIDDDLIFYSAILDEIYNEILEISKQNDVLIKEKELEKYISMKKAHLESIDYLIVNTDETKNIAMTNIKKLRQLSHNYNKLNNLILDIKIDINSFKTEIYSKNFNIANNKLQKLEKSFEGIGGTIISIVLSITIVSVGIVAITSIKPILIPLFILSLVWLGMTFIMFTNSLFKSEDKSNKQAIILYGVITVLLIIVLSITLYFFDKHIDNTYFENPTTNNQIE